jgi:predicted acetyltransferase
MMENLKLVFPEARHEKIWRDAMLEYGRAGEKVVPYALWSGCADYAVYLVFVNAFHSGNGIPPDRVPSSTYFLVGNGEYKILGAVNIRHKLDKLLIKIGGHIGYGIVPSERGKGLGTKQLGLALAICADMGINRVLITCDRHNVASAKTAVNNGAVFESEIIDIDGKTIQRYWIDLNN